ATRNRDIDELEAINLAGVVGRHVGELDQVLRAEEHATDRPGNGRADVIGRVELADRADLVEESELLVGQQHRAELPAEAAANRADATFDGALGDDAGHVAQAEAVDARADSEQAHLRVGAALYL